MKETKGEGAPQSPGATIATAQPAVEAISATPAVKETKGEGAPQSPGATVSTAQPAAGAIYLSVLE